MREAVSLFNAQQGHAALMTLWDRLKPMLMAGNRFDIVVKKGTRSLAQNSLMWSCLTDLSEQVKWDGSRRLTPEGWKDYLTAHLKGQDLVPNMDGNGFVAIGRGSSTSSMTVAEMSELIELAHAFGSTRSVEWSNTSLGRDDV